MRKLCLSLGLLFAVSSHANVEQDPYAFTKDFELVKITMNGAVAAITVKHKNTFVEPKFELVAGQACAESYPAQCYGTVVRLDDSGTTDGTSETTFQVDLTKLFYNEGVVLTVYGPQSKKISVQY